MLLGLVLLALGIGVGAAIATDARADSKPAHATLRAGLPRPAAWRPLFGDGHSLPLPDPVELLAPPAIRVVADLPEPDASLPPSWSPRAPRARGPPASA